MKKLLESPVRSHSDVDIKFKPTNKAIDHSAFILRTPIAKSQKEIEILRLNLYIDTLVGDNRSPVVSNLSTAMEQILLVQYNTELGQLSLALSSSEFRSLRPDFEKVRQKHRARPNLLDRHISFVEVYECHTVEVRFKDEQRLVKHDDLRQLFEPVWKNLFTFELLPSGSASVEFLTAAGKS